MENRKKVVTFDLWETLIFGTKDSAISMFYKEITKEEINPKQLKKCMLITESKPRLFLEKFLQIVTPSNRSSMLFSLKNRRSPLYSKIIRRFNVAVKNDFREIRWVPGAVELLESLRKKYTLAVVSNLWAYQKKHLFNDLNLKKYFDKCLFSCDLGMNKNDILKNIQGILQTDINNIVYIGRSYEYDIIPAVNANLSALRLIYDRNIIFPSKMEQMIDEKFNNEVKEPFQITELAAKIETRKLKTLLVIPPFYKLLGSHNNRINLGAAYISAYLSSKGYTNKIYHCDSASSEKYITRYQMVFNSIEFYKSLETDKSYGEFENYYEKNFSDIVFVTCGDILNPSFDSGNWDSARKIAKIVRKANPKAYIVAIGAEVGIESDDFDLLIYGEVEDIIDEVIEKKLRGKVWGGLLADSRLHCFPNFDIKNMATEISPISLDTIIWRRGCKGKCDFCRVAQINKGIIRYRPMELVFEEIKLRYKLLKLKNFYLVDANFTSDKKLGIEFCRRLKKEFPDITWRTESRFDTLDKELLIEMKKAGCTHVKLGLENALHERHHVKTKRININSAYEWIRYIQQEVGIDCIIYLMLGGKWFTREQYNQMYQNTKNLNANGYTVSLFTPYPGTNAGIPHGEWKKRKFTGSHLDIRLIDFWKIPIDIVEMFFSLELEKGREDRNIRKFNYQK